MGLQKPSFAGWEALLLASSVRLGFGSGGGLQQ